MPSAVGLSGCAKKIEVQSDTSWDGYVNGGSVEGSGFRTFNMKRGEPCYSFQKRTSEGWLAVKPKGWASGESPHTDVPYGAVSGCIE